MNRSTIDLDFYGITVRVTGPAALVDGIRLDFSWFELKDAAAFEPAVTVEAFDREPPYGRVPAVKATLYLPDAIAYGSARLRYVDYQGKALGIFDYAAERGELYSDDPDLLHELVYLMVHSRAGELLDRRGLHRVHALGVSVRGKGILCLLPQGAGKTTLCQGILDSGEVKILADDIPLVDRAARLLPFPLRLGLSEAAARRIPAEYCLPFVRRKYGKKTLVSVEYYREQISPVVPCAALLVGERRFSPTVEIVPINMAAALVALMRNCVAGLGLPQVVEYFLRADLRDVASKTLIVVSRFLASLALVRKARLYRFILGNDPSANAAALKAFLEKI